MKDLDERGNALFYALCLLPLLLSFTALIVDISAWYTLGDELQQSADTLALHAAQFLPDKEESIRSINDEVSLLGSRQKSSLLPEGSETSSFFPEDSTQSVGVEVRAQYRGGLSKLFPGLSEHRFLLKKQAVAELSPLDMVFILADGGTLRPGVKLGVSPSGVDSLEPPWGEELSWPSSGYFHCAHPLVIPQPKEASTWAWWKDWEKQTFQRWVTQSCFNPSLSALKLGVLSLLDELQAGKENRVSVIYSPGENELEGFSILKPLKEDNLNRSQVVWTGYSEINGLLGDEVCMLLSEEASALGTRFALPGNRLFNQHEEESANCGQPLPSAPCGGPHRVNANLSRCFLEESLGLRQSIYWHMARGGTSSPNLGGAIHQALLQFSDRDFGREEGRIRSSRKNLSQSPTRSILLLSDVLPDLDRSVLPGAPTLREELLQLRNAETSLTVVAYAHEHLSPSARALLLERSGELDELKAKGIPIEVIRAESSVALERSILPQLLLRNRHSLLRE